MFNIHLLPTFQALLAVQLQRDVSLTSHNTGMID